MSKVFYQRIARQPELVKRLHEYARSVIPKGSHIVTLADMAALGRNDPTLGEHILHQMFKMVPGAPGAIHPDAIRELGAGSPIKGRRVIEAFLKRAHEQHENVEKRARGGAADDDDAPQEEASPDTRVKLAGDVVLFPFVEPAGKDWSGRYGASSGDELLKRLTRNSLSKALGGVENVTPLSITPTRADGGAVQGPPDKRELQSYHEAGHIIVARALGVPVHHVDIRRERKGRGVPGVVRFEGGGSEADAMIAMAGPIADSIRFPTETPRHGWRGDEWNIAHAGVAAGDRHRLEQEATTLLKDNWSAVERVATVLMERPFLNGKELDALIAEPEAEQHSGGGRVHYVHYEAASHCNSTSGSRTTSIMTKYDDSLLDHPVLWTEFLRRLGSGDPKLDAETIKSFAEMLGVSPRRVVNKLRAHLHLDHPTVN